MSVEDEGWGITAGVPRAHTWPVVSRGGMRVPRFIWMDALYASS